jgi:aconitate hydratase
MFLGIRTVLSKSFARIHRDNLINFGILPLVFVNSDDYAKLNQNDTIKIKGIRKILSEGIISFSIQNLTQNSDFEVKCDLSDRERKIILAGGKLAYTTQIYK